MEVEQSGSQQGNSQTQSESQPSNTISYHAVLGDAKIAQQHAQVFHHQVETTHDDGENVKTQKQVTKYGSISGGAAQVRYHGVSVNGLPHKYFSTT